VSHSCGEKFAEIEVLPIARAQNRGARSAAGTLSAKSRTRPGQKCTAERSRFTCERRIRAAAISRVRGDISPFTDTRDNSHNLCNLDCALAMRSGLVRYFNESDVVARRGSEDTERDLWEEFSSRAYRTARKFRRIHATCSAACAFCGVLWSRRQDNQMAKRSFMKRHRSRLMHPRRWSLRLNLGNVKHYETDAAIRTLQRNIETRMNSGYLFPSAFSLSFARSLIVLISFPRRLLACIKRAWAIRSTETINDGNRRPPSLSIDGDGFESSPLTEFN
jgi:hypothetical protein